MYRIFIVEDDAVIAGEIARHIESWGYEARCARDFRNVLAEFAAFDPHLVLMDIGLPFYNGYHWCRKIRENSQVPVVFLSSAADNMNIVLAMDMGGDDFIAKPFELTVLMAKLQAMLRRAYDFAGHTGLIEHGGALLNLNDSSLTGPEGRAELTKNEFRILQTLLEKRGQTVPREELMRRLWETDSFVDENTLNVNVTRLRKRLESVGLKDYISTQKGVGYRVG